MVKKNFKIENAVDKFFTKPENSTHDTQNELYEHDTHNTQRRQKNPRINMAFYNDHLEYLQMISRIKGISITQYVNDLILVDKKKNREIINKAKELFK